MWMMYHGVQKEQLVQVANLDSLLKKFISFQVGYSTTACWLIFSFMLMPLFLKDKVNKEESCF